MTPDDIQRVRATVADVDLEQLAARFYSVLFARHPELVPLFPDDTTALQVKFATELAAIAHAIGDFDDFLGRTHGLGVRHAGYGVASADYRRVGEVLLDVLAAEPGVDDAALAAWRAAYTMVAEAMMEGAGSNPFARRPVDS